MKYTLAFEKERKEEREKRERRPRPSPNEVVESSSTHPQSQHNGVEQKQNKVLVI